MAWFTEAQEDHGTVKTKQQDNSNLKIVTFQGLTWKQRGSRMALATVHEVSKQLRTQPIFSSKTEEHKLMLFKKHNNLASPVVRRF